MLTLLVVSQMGRRLATPLTGQFGPAGGIIGRSPDCALVLPDPGRHISRQQARVNAGPAGHTITCLSAANPLIVNGREVAEGQTIPLAHGDTILIAEYEIKVDATAARGSSAGAPDNVFGDFAATPPAPAAKRPAAGGLATSPSPAIEAVIPLDFDPFAEPEPAKSSAPAQAAPILPEFDWAASPQLNPPAPGPGPDTPLYAPDRDRQSPNPFGDPGGRHASVLDPMQRQAQNLDGLFGLDSAKDPLGMQGPLGAPASSSALSPAFSPDKSSLDPLALFGGAARAEPPNEPSRPDHVREIDASFRLPEPIPATTFKVPDPEPPKMNPAPSGDAYRSWQAPPDDGPKIAPLRSPKPRAGVVPPEELRKIAEQAADAHHADFEPMPKTRPTAFLDELNDKQVRAMHDGPGHGAPGRQRVPQAAPPMRPDGYPDEAAFELLKGLLLGLGLSELPKAAGKGAQVPAVLTPELMRRIGELLREATHGTVQLLQARAMLKREMRSEVTMIASEDNNPLKFSPDGQAAVAHLLAARTVRGFMEPVPAMQDAYNDLLAHQFGFVAGVRAAIAGLIARFDPQGLETRLTSRTVIESVIPLARKARLWELFTEMFGEVAREAEDDFDKLFGREFVRAYEEQIERLKAEKPRS